MDGYLSIVESESKDGVIRRLRLRTQDHYRFLDPNPQQRNLVEIQLDIHIRAIEAAGDDREVATLFKQYVDLLRRLGRNY